MDGGCRRRRLIWRGRRDGWGGNLDQIVDRRNWWKLSLLSYRFIVHQPTIVKLPTFTGYIGPPMKVEDLGSFRFQSIFTITSNIIPAVFLFVIIFVLLI